MSVHYTVSGSVIDIGGQLLNITGWVDFDEQLRYWASGDTVPLDETGNSQVKFSITGYALTAGNYGISGVKGHLYMELDLAPGSNRSGDFMWFFEEGTGDWSKWTGDTFHFLNEDGSYKERNARTYRNLADSILLLAFDYNENDPILPRCSSDFKLLLTRHNCVPIAPHSLRVLDGSPS